MHLDRQPVRKVEPARYSAKEKLKHLGRFVMRKILPAMAAAYVALYQPQDRPAVFGYQNPPESQRLGLDVGFAPDQQFEQAFKDGTTVPPESITAAFLAGSFAWQPIFVQSNGSIDPKTMPDWTPEQIQKSVQEVTEGFDWWKQWDPERANLSFVLEPPIVISTGFEPIIHDGRTPEGEGPWIDDVLTSLGQTDPGKTYFEKARAEAHELRLRKGTDWAGLIFFVNDYNDPDHMFKNFVSAYTYSGGPIIVHTANDNGYGPELVDAVHAHEFGHVVYMWDENPDWACTLLSVGYIPGFPNSNSLQPPGCEPHVPSIMEGGDGPYTNNELSIQAARMAGLYVDSNSDSVLDIAGTYQNVYTVTQTTGAIRFSGDITNTGWPPPPGWPPINVNYISEVTATDLFSKQSYPVTATDGVFDEQVEGYQFTAPADSKLIQFCIKGYIGGKFCQPVWDQAKHQYLPLIRN